MPKNIGLENEISKIQGLTVNEFNNPNISCDSLAVELGMSRRTVTLYCLERIY